MSYQWPKDFLPRVVRPAFGGGRRLSAFTIALEAWRRDITVEVLDGTLNKFRLSDVDRSIEFDGSRPSLTNPEAIKVANSKYRTNQALQLFGLPAPEAKQFRPARNQEDEILHGAETLGFPVVLKPARGSKGRGVFSEIANPAQLREAYNHLINDLQISSLVLEKHVHGSDYRVYVAGQTAAAACRRLPANIVGDGINSITGLIALKNKERKQNPFLSSGLILPDYETDSFLREAYFEYSDVPAKGTFIQLRAKANASAGGDVVDVTHELPQPILNAAVESVQAIPGLASAGVDILYDEDSPESGFKILEINARAHIGVNMYPSIGSGQDVPNVIIDEFFPGSARKHPRLERNLGIDTTTVLYPILAGAVSTSTITPLASHRFPDRRRYRTHIGKLDAMHSRHLIRRARELGVAGYLHGIDENGVMQVAGEHETVDTFLTEYVSLTRQPLEENTSRWRGVVHPGFTIRQ